MDKRDVSSETLDIACLFPEYPFVVNGSHHEGITLDTDDMAEFQQEKIVWNHGSTLAAQLRVQLTVPRILIGLQPYLHLIGLDRQCTEIHPYKQGTYSHLYVLKQIAGTPNRSGVFNTRQYVLKINLPVWSYFKTSSEAATLQYLYRYCPEIPVPRVHAFDANFGKNDLGFEWLIMDKLDGVRYKDIESSMSVSQKIQIARKLAQWHMILARDCQFNHLGSIYMRHTVPEGVHQQQSDSAADGLAASHASISNEHDLFTVGVTVPRRIGPPGTVAIDELQVEGQRDSYLQHMSISPRRLFINPQTGEPTGLCGWSRTTTQEPTSSPYYPTVLRPETYRWELDMDLKTPKKENENRKEEVDKGTTVEMQKNAEVKKNELPPWPVGIPKTASRLSQEKTEGDKRVMDLMRYTYRSVREKFASRPTRVKSERPYERTNLRHCYSTENVHEYNDDWEDFEADDDEDGNEAGTEGVLPTIDKDRLENEDEDDHEEREYMEESGAEEEEWEDGERRTSSPKLEQHKDEEPDEDGLPSVVESILEDSEEYEPKEGATRSETSLRFAVTQFADPNITWYGEEEIL